MRQVMPGTPSQGNAHNNLTRAKRWHGAFMVLVA
jgi:hypothetical protein